MSNNNDFLTNLHIRKYFQKVSTLTMDYFRKRTKEEKGLIIFAILLGIFMFVRNIWLDIDNVFIEKENELKQVEQWREALPYRITDYLQLSAKKSSLEDEYNSLQGSGDVRADIEDLLKKQSGVQSNFSIKALSSDKFAESYEQTPYNVVFSVTEYQSLLNVLKELHEGQKPLIIRTIDVQKSQGGRYLTVKLDLIGLRKVKRR